LIKKENYIKNLIAQGEHQKLDFKFEIADSKKIARTLVAFANTDGGTLLVGVKDNGALAGVRSDEEFYMVEAAATMYCRPQIDFVSRTWTVEGKTVVEIIIPKSAAKPHKALSDDGKWLAYIRVEDENILANAVLLKVWQRRESKKNTTIRFTEKEKFILNYMEENDSITLSKVCKIAKIKRKQAEAILVNLIVLRIVRFDFSKKGFFYSLNLLDD
jgi:predicted HTH transcriptional regulator